LRTILFAGLLVLACAPGRTAAQAATADRETAGTKVYLLTMGQGDLVWEKFGHNAIWLHDPVAGTDRVYNYGVFDFDSPGYWSRFIKGNWIYRLAVDDIRETLAQYRYFDRSVIAQEINLTASETAELQTFLEWNARPENREYLYDYYRDNCSTRVRDVLDRFTGGALSAGTAGTPTSRSYRWHTRRLIASDRLAYAGISVGLGPSADRPISAWEEMFLPEKLMERARQIRIRRGNELEPLVLSERVLYAAAGREPERREPPAWLLWALVIGLALGAAFAGLGHAAAGGGAAARFAFAAAASVWSLGVGTGGILLLALWGLTNHTIAHANENLLHLSPAAVALVLLLPALAYGARWAARPAWWAVMLVAASSALGLILQILPAMDQVNGEVIAFMLPAHLGLAWAVHELAKR
jgi:hypothetical protein